MIRCLSVFEQELAAQFLRHDLLPVFRGSPYWSHGVLLQSTDVIFRRLSPYSQTFPFHYSGWSLISVVPLLLSRFPYLLIGFGVCWWAGGALFLSWA